MHVTCTYQTRYIMCDIVIILLSEKFNWVVSHFTFPLLTKCSIGIHVLIVRIQYKMVGMTIILYKWVFTKVLSTALLLINVVYRILISCASQITITWGNGKEKTFLPKYQEFPSMISISVLYGFTCEWVQDSNLCSL